MTDLAKLNGFAVDLGGTKTAIARIVRGKIEMREVVRTDAGAPPHEHIAMLADMLRDIGYQRADCLGVAVTGRIDRSGNWHAINTATLSGVAAVPLGKLIVETIGPATPVNDAAAATFAEVKIGSGKGLQNFGYVTVSTGVGGGLFLGGRLHQSANGLAGHIGFTSSSHGQVLCGSGRHGTVESVASGTAIARAAQAAGHPGLDAREVFERARLQEAWAGNLIGQSAHAIGDLCADLTASLGLEAIAIGGSVGLGEGYLDRVRSHMAGLPDLFRPSLTLASLGHDGPLLGALLLADGKD